MFLNTLGSTRSCVRPTYICVLSFLSLVLALGLSLDAAAVELPFGAKHEVSLPGIGHPGQGHGRMMSVTARTTTCPIRIRAREVDAPARFSCNRYWRSEATWRRPIPGSSGERC